MDFTREPIIETVITPKDGCKLVVRSSKSIGQEEYFVDAVEVVSFGHSFFFRSLERPKMFFVPATDYEVLEVRETRMVLKNVGIDRPIKIGGGREAPMRSQPQREPHHEKEQVSPAIESKVDPVESIALEKPVEAQQDKKRDRRRHSRRRRDKDAPNEESSSQSDDKPLVDSDKFGPSPIMNTSVLSALLPPPSVLISETIGRYKDNILFKDAFYIKEEQKEVPSDSILPVMLDSEFVLKEKEPLKFVSLDDELQENKQTLDLHVPEDTEEDVTSPPEFSTPSEFSTPLDDE